MVDSVAPNSVNIGFKNINEIIPIIAPTMIDRAVVLDNTSDALPYSFCPKNMEIMDAPPIPIKVQNAIIKFIKGKVIANPDIAIAPTPRPINMLSTMLYRDIAVMAIIVGME